VGQAIVVIDSPVGQAIGFCRLPFCPVETGHKPGERRKMRSRFAAAMAAYAVLALLAAWTLDGKIRLATWLLLGLFAVKTVLAVLRGHLD
jgi:hypothetical protein